MDKSDCSRMREFLLKHKLGDIMTTYHTSYRGEITDIATIARWMVTEGFIPRSRNEMINTAIKNFVSIINHHNPELLIEDVADAYEYLEEIGMAGRDTALPSLSKKMLDTPKPPGSTSIDDKLGQKGFNRRIMAQADEAMELMEKAQKRAKDDQKAIDSLGCLPD